MPTFTPKWLSSRKKGERVMCAKWHILSQYNRPHGRENLALSTLEKPIPIANTRNQSCDQSSFSRRNPNACTIYRCSNSGTESQLKCYNFHWSGTVCRRVSGRQIVHAYMVRLCDFKDWNQFEFDRSDKVSCHHGMCFLRKENARDWWHLSQPRARMAFRLILSLTDLNLCSSFGIYDEWFSFRGMYGWFFH